MSRLGESPTVQTLLAMAVVFLTQQIAGFVGLWSFLFVLGPTFPLRPWVLVTSVYAHAGFAHLLSNALMLALVGLLVEQITSRVRFHAFFVTTGALAGLSQVVLTGGRVLGASGAVFALLGYLLTANPVSSSVLDGLGLSRRAQLLLFGVLAVAVTLATGRPGVALVAHFTGFLLGLVAGRLRLLRVGRAEPRGEAQATNQPPSY